MRNPLRQRRQWGNMCGNDVNKYRCTGVLPSLFPGLHCRPASGTRTAVFD